MTTFKVTKRADGVTLQIYKNGCQHPMLRHDFRLTDWEVRNLINQLQNPIETVRGWTGSAIIEDEIPKSAKKKISPFLLEMIASLPPHQRKMFYADRWSPCINYPRNHGLPEFQRVMEATHKALTEGDDEHE